MLVLIRVFPAVPVGGGPCSRLLASRLNSELRVRRPGGQERKKERRQLKGGMGGRHAATTQGGVWRKGKTNAASRLGTPLWRQIFLILSHRRCTHPALVQYRVLLQYYSTTVYNARPHGHADSLYRTRTRLQTTYNRTSLSHMRTRRNNSNGRSRMAAASISPSGQATATRGRWCCASRRERGWVRRASDALQHLRAGARS